MTDGRDERRRRQAAAFDQIGERYDEAFPHKDGQLAAGAWLIGRLRPGARVLDAGCGTGLPTARQLDAAGLEVTGIDISPVMLGLARRHVPGAVFRELDIRDVSRDLGTFDAVTAFFSLLMLPRAQIPGALAKLRGVLAPGGLLALAMVEADVDDVPTPFLGAPIRVTGYPLAGLREVVTGAGFAICDESRVTYAPAVADLPAEVQVTLCCERA